jgi:anti-sigma B factor antagonist
MQMTHEETQQPGFGYAISQRCGTTLITFSGELDIVAAPTMRQAFLDADAASASGVEVDLTAATFLDSTGLGIIIAACRRARAHDGVAFGVTCPDGIARSVIEISGLIDYLQVKGGE